MTISTQYTPDNYAGDGVVTVFAVTFEFLSVSTNVKVSLKVDATGVVTEQTVTTEYTISGSNVTFITPPASGETIILELNPDFTQDSVYTENSRLPATTLETDLDERVLESQINSDLIDRALKFDSAVTISGTLGNVPDPTSNGDKYLKLNLTADGWEYVTLSSSAGLGNIVEDTTPQLGADLDANGFNVAFDTATGILDNSGNEQLIFNKTASAVNHLEATNASTGNAPSIASAGETNVDLNLKTAGTGNIDIEDASIKLENTEGILDDSDNEQLIFNKTASAVNHLAATNAATGNNPKLTAEGSDTDIPLELSGKGGVDGGVYVEQQRLWVARASSAASAVNYLTPTAILLTADSFASDSLHTAPLMFGSTDPSFTTQNPKILASVSGFSTEAYTTDLDGGMGIALNTSPDNPGATHSTVVSFCAFYTHSEVRGTSVAPGELRITEDSSNGTNYIGFKSPAAVTTSVSYEIPEDGTTGQVLSTDGSGILSWTLNATEATQSAVEAETAEATFVPPDLVKNSPGVSKGWVHMNGTGTIAIVDSYNVTSITDNGVGSYAVTWATDFSATGYCVQCTCSPDVSSNDTVYANGNAVGSADINTFNDSAAADLSRIYVTAFGDQ